VRALDQAGDENLAAIAARLRAGIDALGEAGRYVLDEFQRDTRAVLAGAVPFLELAGIVCGGAQLARAASIAAKKLAAGEGDAAFLRTKIATARHFADHCLTHAPALRDTVVDGGAAALAIADEAF
jgi:acyl-CoA dehydrogenase